MIHLTVKISHFLEELDDFQLCPIWSGEYTFISLVMFLIERESTISSVPRLSSILRY